MEEKRIIKEYYVMIEWRICVFLVYIYIRIAYENNKGSLFNYKLIIKLFRCEAYYVTDVCFLLILFRSSFHSFISSYFY